jgi:hypothetical protein
MTPCGHLLAYELGPHDMGLGIVRDTLEVRDFVRGAVVLYVLSLKSFWFRGQVAEASPSRVLP